MNPAQVVLLADVVAVTFVATELLARLAPAAGWTDAPRAADAARKLQGRAVPAVGGAALLVGLAWTPRSAWTGAGIAWSWLPGQAWLLVSLLTLFAAGTWDDRAALGPGRKALVQVCALAPLVAGMWAEGAGAGRALGVVLAGFVALNLLNTFDNADGALAGLCALGFAFSLPFASAACLGFLPLNMDAARARNRAGRSPSAYLGDAGAFVLAFLVLATPSAWGILVLPALDLARLAVVRLRAGSRPWIGDRRHLAHRLEACGLAPAAVAALQCGIALPSCALVPRAIEHGDPRLAGLGVCATAGLFLAALAACRVRRGANGT